MLPPEMLIVSLVFFLGSSRCNGIEPIKEEKNMTQICLKKKRNYSLFMYFLFIQAVFNNISAIFQTYFPRLRYSGFISCVICEDVNALSGLKSGKGGEVQKYSKLIYCLLDRV